ncbi:CLUMA_CG001405, isoform A, partial [Clunio marinus]
IRKHLFIPWRKYKNQLNYRLINFDNKNKSLTMNEVYFKHLVEEQKIAISFRFVQTINSFKIDRIFNFVRDLTENIDVSLNRIKNNVEREVTKKISKKKKKSKDGSEGSNAENFTISAEFCDSNGTITNKSFQDLLGDFENSEFQLKLHQIPFTVKFNWPWINTITLPTSILAGFYVYPSKLEIDFADRHATEFIWYRGELPANERENEIEWEEIGKGFTFLVRPEDIGYRLKVSATPKSIDSLKIGPTVEAIGKNEVQAGPGYCPFEARHLFTVERLSGKSIRVASYNLLADYYADSEDGRTKLFSYCPGYAITIDYRKQLLLKEIVGYNADIFCMQEVDFKIFDGDMIPLLLEQNMTGVHNKKGTTPEGVATFYRQDRFELIENYVFNIGETVKSHSACQELFGKLQYNEKLVERLTDLGTTLQVLVLRSKEFPEKFFTVANTHLYFHPDADHIRLLQIGFSMKIVEDIVERLKEKSSDVSLIFCGDFNSVPECGIYKLMTQKSVPENFIDWKSNQEQEVKNVSLSQPFQMKSACGTPTFTNYTIGFQACLDYIFYQTDKFHVTKVVEMPDEEELKSHIAIPSVVFPSDHIAIIADLEMT